MNRHKLLSIGVGTVLILGIVGGVGFSSVVASSENPLDIGLQNDDEEEEEEDINVSQIEVSAQQAIAIAENETNGTVVELELVTEAVNETEEETETAADNETEDENETLVWEVELIQDGTEQEVLVDATDGTVLDVQTEDGEQDDADEAENDDNEETEQETETTTTQG